jgi:hypothetical protein
MVHQFGLAPVFKCVFTFEMCVFTLVLVFMSLTLG